VQSGIGANPNKTEAVPAPNSEQNPNIPRPLRLRAGAGAGGVLAHRAAPGLLIWSTRSAYPLRSQGLSSAIADSNCSGSAFGFLSGLTSPTCEILQKAAAMSAERSWSADTVALDRKAGGEEARPEPQRRRVSRPKLRALGPRALALGALALAIAVGAGSKSPPTPIREVADPAPQVVVKPPTRMRRRKSRRGAKRRIHREGGAARGRARAKGERDGARAGRTRADARNNGGTEHRIFAKSNATRAGAAHLGEH